MLTRRHWLDRNRRLDPVADRDEISRTVATLEFPWDTLQSLSFALFRTYAVPSIGRLLAETGEFTERVQKRYDDTGLLLEEVQQRGFEDPQGRAAVRRINQMHAIYDISNDDMRYVLATFVVIPKRWIDRFGYRRLDPVEIDALTNYYLELGRHMAIKDLPADFSGFERLLDDYERDHFGYDAGGRRVADSTLELMTTFPPNNFAPRWLVKRFAWSLMEDHLLDAFGYPHPTRAERIVFTGAMRARALLLSRLPARRTPKLASGFGYFRSYPGGFAIGDLGTFGRSAK